MALPAARLERGVAAEAGPAGMEDSLATIVRSDDGGPLDALVKRWAGMDHIQEIRPSDPSPEEARCRFAEGER
jgi:hypothetical protein